jgi:hypothetical protein
MHDVALLSLLHDRGKLAVAGVSLAATLLLVQIGLFAAFLDTSSAIVRRIGGDVWVMARGTEVVDNGETLSAGSRAAVAARACVRAVRGVVIAVDDAYAEVRGVAPGTEDLGSACSSHAVDAPRRTQLDATQP